MWKRLDKVNTSSLLQLVCVPAYQELDDFKSDPPGDAVVWPINGDIWHWEGFFEGPVIHFAV